MTIQLTEYILDPIKVLEYVTDNFQNGNALSIFCLSHIKSTPGRFFTLLPNTIPPADIHEFTYGDTKSHLRSHIAEILLNKLERPPFPSCIFDDTITTYKPNYHDSLFDPHGLFHKQDIYYLVTPKTASHSLVDECVRASFDGFWHSLIVLTTHDFSHKQEKSLTESEFHNICKKAKLILIGAYDAEGYIFWEPEVN